MSFVPGNYGSNSPAGNNLPPPVAPAPFNPRPATSATSQIDPPAPQPMSDCEARVRQLEAELSALRSNRTGMVKQRDQGADYAMFLAQQRAQNVADNAALDARSKIEMNRMLSSKRLGPSAPPSGALDALLG